MTKKANEPHKQILEYGVGDLPIEQSENLQPKITEKKLNGDSLNSSIQLPNSSGIKETDFSKYRLSQDFISQVGVKKSCRLCQSENQANKNLCGCTPIKNGGCRLLW